jgi:serine/threonine-protein kinase RsbW
MTGKVVGAVLNSAPVAGRQIIRLEVPGELKSRNVALRTVSAACQLVRRDGKEPDPRDAQAFRNHIVSAVSEAFNNIALHGYRGMTPDVVRIDIELDDSGVTIELRDFGRSFDPRCAVEPNLDDLPTSGLGIFIMRSFVDEVDYSPGRPNILKLMKRVV